MKAGFMSSEGWIDMPPTNSQRREPLISSPTKSTSHHQHEADDEHDQRSAAHLARRQEGNPDHQQQRERGVERVAEHEMQAVEAEALGDRRARGEGEHAAGQEQHETSEIIGRSTVHHQSDKGER